MNLIHFKRDSTSDNLEKNTHYKLFAALLMPALLLLTTRNAGACACGCGTYNVGTSYNFPKEPGAIVWTEYDYVGQSQNWSGLGPSDRCSSSIRLPTPVPQQTLPIPATSNSPSHPVSSSTSRKSVSTPMPNSPS